MKASLITHYFSSVFWARHTLNPVCGTLSLLLLLTGCALHPMPPSAAPAPADYTAAHEKITGKDAGIAALIADMRAGDTKTIDGRTVTAGLIYDAASGRPCKTITLIDATNQAAGQTRLACKNGTRWFFVVDIFSSTGLTNPTLR
jgi:hypothetical protein